MGRVFRGVHARSRAAVAIKVLTGDRASDPALCAAFRDEVRAAAALDHPGIVTVFDQSTVSLAAARASGKELSAGAPFLVMELVPHGTLVELCRAPDGAHRPLSFSTLRAVLLDLLDALAHAHARGVIHRDLKPGNVMLSGSRSAHHTRVKLTDFGIAFRMDAIDRSAASRANAFSGTPHYMAPEQADGRVREIGPWTDIYALGCVAYRLASGRPPYHHTGNDVAETMRCQIAEPVPPIESATPLPDAFAQWMASALAKRWEDRFRCAADAAAALAEIPADDPHALPQTEPHRARGTITAARASEPSTDELETRVMPGASEISGSPRVAPRTTQWREPSSQQPTVLFTSSPSDRPPAARSAAQRVATLPLDPRPRERAHRPLSLVDAGLGLFALRQRAMVGRERERSTLWRALFDVHTEKSARAVIVESPIGQGKSTLFDWFTTRAKELGGASVLSAIHSAQPGPSDGLGPMLARSLRTTGLSRDAALAPTLDAVRRMGGRVSDAIALVEITHPVSDRDRGDGPSVRFANARERTHSVLRYIELLCRERPVIVRVDDGHFAPDALALVRALLDAPTPLPVLCVLDADLDALAERPAEAAAIDELRAHSRAQRTDLSSLSTDEQRALVQGLLSLRPSLVDAVVERAGSSPLFAVQIVTDWVQRGVVRATADGFDLLGDEALTVAAQLHALLLGRVTRLLDAPRVACVERAATLGAAFDPAEWRAACATIDATIDDASLDAALDALVLDGLLVRGEDRCSFAHSAIVEALVRNARERGALAEHHRACARALSARPAAVATLARIARHLARSGDFEAALAPMLEAAWESYERSDFAGAIDALTERDRWIDAMDLAESDPRRAEGWVRLALVCARTARVTEAGAWLDRVEAFVRAHPSDAIEADLVHGRAKTAQMSGDMQRSGALFARASRSYAALSRAQGVALSEHGLAEVLKQAGRAAESEPHYAAALTAYERAGDRVGAANCRLGWAELVNRTDRARGDAMLTEAVCALEAVGNRLGVAIAQQIKGLAARYDERLDEAHDAFVRAAEMLDAVGSHDAAIARSNAAVVDLLRGRFVRATRVFEDVHRLFTKLGREGYLCFASVELLACRAHAGDWAGFDALIEEAERLLPKSGLIDEDLELCLRIAMERATQHGQDERAARVEPLWRAQQRALAEQSGYSQ